MSATATNLHDAAMAMADDALAARRRGDSVAAKELFGRASEAEEQAARAVAAAENVEPTRSILFRSAASLALEAGRVNDAERLVTAGLAGNPPEDVAEELRELRERMAAPQQQEDKARTISARSTGTVRWFNDAKGFGFITVGGEDVFVHSSAIRAKGFRSLAEGSRVELDVVQGPKGLQAVNVTPAKG